MGSHKKTQTVGYRYGLTVHMGVCYGPVDQVNKILADDREAYGQPINGTGTVGINAPGLFGGDEKEGGLSGTMHVQMGAADQNPSGLLTPHLGGNIPAFRGILGFVYSGIMSANNPYLKPFSFVVKRILKGWQDDQVWYPEKAAIKHITAKGAEFFDANPAHIVYECLTNTDWGMGYPVASLDDANFRAAADTLYNEGFGLSLLWNQQNSIEAFLGIIFSHIAGSLNVDPKTGLYQIRLVRQDYDATTLQVFNPDNIIELTNYQRVGYGELVNEITLKYTDPDTYSETAITLQDLASIAVQDSAINQTIVMTGITNAALAQRVAQRELVARSSPLAKVQIKINRNAWRLMPNGVFRLVWPVLGIAGVVMRVTNVGTGTLDSGVITVDAVEDVFGLPDSTYTNQQGPSWTDPLQPPAPAPSRLFTEATYHDLITTLSAADLAYIDGDDGYPIMYASSPSVAAFDYKLLLATHGSGQFKEVDQQAHTAIGVVLDSLPVGEFSMVAISTSNTDDITAGEYAIIDNEYVRIDGFDPDTSTVTLTRGILDTVPQAHAANAIIYFADSNGATDAAAWPIGSVIDAKVITSTGQGKLDPALAPIDTITVKARHNKPYPPAKFRINNQYMPESVEGAISVSWLERNRLTQDSHILSQTDLGQPAEPDTTYTVNIYDQDDSLCRSVTGLTGNSYTYPLNDELADCGGMQTHIRVELLAVRDGIESWQAHSHRFERVYGGYGFGYGDEWGSA